jgi:hypothetical protein
MSSVFLDIPRVWDWKTLPVLTVVFANSGLTTTGRSYTPVSICRMTTPIPSQRLSTDTATLSLCASVIANLASLLTAAESPGFAHKSAEAEVCRSRLKPPARAAHHPLAADQQSADRKNSRETETPKPQRTGFSRACGQKVRSSPPKGLINPIWCSFGPILLRKRSISTVLLAPEISRRGVFRCWPRATPRLRPHRIRPKSIFRPIERRGSCPSRGAPLLAGRRPPRVMAHGPARAFPCRALGDLRSLPGATVQTVRADRLHWCHRPVPERSELVQTRLDRGHFAPFCAVFVH